jgi:hypothetical protein
MNRRRGVRFGRGIDGGRNHPVVDKCASSQSYAAIFEILRGSVSKIGGGSFEKRGSP